MTFADSTLARGRPATLRRQVRLPRRQRYLASPEDWRDEVLYFLLIDRFSDGGEDARPLLDRANRKAARPTAPDGTPWRWDRWAESGADRWQGGTLAGVASKLPYLQQLGVTALWLSPIFKQRGHLDTYHGYGVQDFLDVDPRLGSRQDLVDLCASAHRHGMRIILDIIFNHTGKNWNYPAGTTGGQDKPDYNRTGRYAFGSWLDAKGQAIPGIGGSEDGVWPEELQDPACYTRAGRGDLGAGDIADSAAEHKRTDFEDLRDIDLDFDGVLANLAGSFKYWIALTDCDGFRIDTVKHVTTEQARNFCGTMREFAATLGKLNFFLLAEVAGGDFAEDFYLKALGRNLSAALDIGEMRRIVHGVAKGLQPAVDYFERFKPGSAVMGSHRDLGDRHVSICDDHDHVSGGKIRFSAEAATDHQVAAAVALQLFTLGIPCIYYGTEQGFAGPEVSERHWLPEWNSSDRYLREAMFGPSHPRLSGRAGVPPAGADSNLPGFGPFGTAGHHCFDPTSPAFVRIAALTALRRTFPVLRHGRQYLRQISLLGGPFQFPPQGELVAWSRILDDEEAVCILNGHGDQARGADVVIDAGLNGAPGAALVVIANTAQAASSAAYTGSHPVGEAVPVRHASEGTAFVSVHDLPPSEILVLSNHPSADTGGVLD
jgi:glycosidase